MKVNLIFRKKLPEFYSVEEIFAWLTPEIKKSHQVERIELPHSGNSFGTVFRNIQFIRRKKLKNQIIHITGHENYLVPFCGKNCILTIHDIGFANSGNYFQKITHKLFWFWIPAFFAKKITVISEFTASEVRLLIPFARKKIKVIRNPFNPQLKFSPKQFNLENPTILLVGTKENKNLERAIQAIRRIPGKVIILGKLFDHQIELLEQFKINYTNEFNVTYRKVMDCYIISDLVLFPSLYEGFGLPILEAQTIGRPIITSRVASIPEVAGQGACFTNPHSIKSIENGVLKVLKDKMFREEIIRKGLKNINHFHVRVISAQYNELYLKL